MLHHKRRINQELLYTDYDAPNVEQDLYSDDHNFRSSGYANAVWDGAWLHNWNYQK